MAMKRVGGKKRKLISTGDDEKQCSDLPYEILELIKKRLFFIDQVKFRAVSKSWSCIERIPPLQQMPWLLVFDDEDDDMNSYKLVDSKDKKTYTIDAKAIKDKLKITNFSSMKVHESKYGWLLVSNYYKHHTTTTLFLYSPFFNDNYNLIESPILNCEIFFATFTSNPLDEDCEILTLNTNYRDKTLLINTYRRGQSSWSSRFFECEFWPWSVKSWMYSEGMFYYVTRYGTMGKFDLALEEWNVFPPLPLTIRGLSDIPHYIVKSSDEELFVILERNLSRRYNIWYYHYQHIYRLDLSSMIWEDLDSIGDRVLFIGKGYNSVLNSSVLKFNGERKGVSDKIYYCFHSELKYCSVHDYTVGNSDCGKPRKLPCSRHYGSIAMKRCKKMFIDPPPR